MTRLTFLSIVGAMFALPRALFHRPPALVEGGTMRPRSAGGGAVTLFGIANDRESGLCVATVEPSRERAEAAMEAAYTLPPHRGEYRVVPIRAAFDGNATAYTTAELTPGFDFEPAHLLDLPADLAFSNEWVLPAERESLTRAEAFQAAADFNRRQLEEAEPGDRRWRCVLEVGPLVEVNTAASVEAATDGMGVLSVATYRPVRVTKPTAEEARRFAGRVAAMV